MLYLPSSPQLGVHEPGFQAGLVDVSSMPGSGVDGISACGMGAETECNGRIQGSMVGVEVVEEPDEVAGAEASRNGSLFSNLLIL